MSSESVAVIDIGSNSIKVLVATHAPDGRVVALQQRLIEARISAGISQAAPQLGEEGMTRGLAAVRTLLADVAAFTPARIQLVATSAVRDAQNGLQFRDRIRAATGHVVRLLSGDEEAKLIGRGLTCDPALTGLGDFYVFDLGGGSLECLAFRNCHLQQAISLQLGCVRLTESFVSNPAAILEDATRAQVAAHTRELFARARFAFDLPRTAIAVATGGTMTTVRTIYGTCAGKAFEATDSRITVVQLRELLACLGAMTLAERIQVPGVPEARADVLPAALTTMIAIAELGGFSAFRHSLFNLRWGLAAEMLD